MLRSWSTIQAAMFLGPVFLLVVAGGCGDSVQSVPPSEEAARGALETALKTWRDGGKPGTLSGTGPSVHVTDTPWSEGAQLASYEILKGEQNGGDTQFSVRLSLSKPERTEEARYHVLGSDPLMVFRDEDYQRNINMMDSSKPKGGRSTGRGRRR